MPILASEALLRENKKKSSKKMFPSGNRTTGLGFQVQHAPFYTNWGLAYWEIFQHLFMHHLIFGLLMIQLKSIEHDYIRSLKQMSS